MIFYNKNALQMIFTKKTNWNFINLMDVRKKKLEKQTLYNYW